MKVIILILCFFIIFISFANAGEMYICIDTNGDTIITDVPQDGMRCDLTRDEKRSVTSRNHQNLSPLNDVGRRAAETNNNNQLTGPLINSQSTDSTPSQSIEQKKQNHAPYHCAKLCIQDHRNDRKACSEKRSGDINEYHNCMTKSHEQVNNCRKKCREEENSVASNNVEEDNIETHSKNISSGISTTQLQTVNFGLADKRNPAEREGYPYPNSPLGQHIMHGDRSLNVDRLSILKTKLSERFGSKLNGKIIELTQFYVLEATLRDSFVKTPSGKQIPNTGPFLPTLVSEVSITIDGDFFHGSVSFPMRLSSKATKSALTIATTMAVDDLLKDMERRWNP